MDVWNDCVSAQNVHHLLIQYEYTRSYTDRRCPLGVQFKQSLAQDLCHANTMQQMSTEEAHDPLYHVMACDAQHMK
jgi:hypothetical protein